MSKLFKDIITENKECKITKVQEQEALHYINRFLIDKAAEVFNKNMIGYHIDPNEIRKKFRKILDIRPTIFVNGWKVDRISYEAIIDEITNNDFPKGLKFRFDIGTNEEGAVQAAFTTPLSSTKWFMITKPPEPKPLREDDERLNISKVEEEYILNRIYHEIIPSVINETYNKFLSKYPMANVIEFPRIGYSSIRKNLKKIKRESKLIEYKSKIPGSIISFTFIVFRNFNPNYGEEFIIETISQLGGTKISSTFEIEVPNSKVMESTKNTINENKIYFSITKIEEEESLQFIKRILIPIWVKERNEEISRLNLNQGKNYQYSLITIEDVCRNLKRIDKRNYLNDKFVENQSDVIRFESIIKDPNPKLQIMISKFLKHLKSFSFILTKNKAGELIVSDSSLNIYNIEKQKKEPLFESKFTNNKIMNENHPQDMSDRDDRLTKMEESYSLNYLLRSIMPTALQDTYYKFIERYPDRYPERKYPRLTSNDIKKTIKKIRIGFDRVEYESVINDRIEFQFMVLKEWHLDKIVNGEEIWNLYLMGGVKGPMGDDWKWYDIKYDSLRINEFKKTSTFHTIINEEIGNKNLVLTKEEEGMAYKTIMLNLVPLLVRHYNGFLSRKKEKNMKKKYFLVNDKQVSNNIKKIKREPNRVTYECILKDGHIEIFTVKEMDAFNDGEIVVVGFSRPTDHGWNDASGYTWIRLENLIKKNYTIY